MSELWNPNLALAYLRLIAETNMNKPSRGNKQEQTNKIDATKQERLERPFAEVTGLDEHRRQGRGCG